MEYTTLAEIEAAKSVTEIIQVTDGVSAPDMTKVNEAIKYARVVIDGRLCGSVVGWVAGEGITPFPDLIRFIATDLAIFRLFSLKYGETTTVYNEKGIYKRLEKAEKDLIEIQKKNIKIGSTEKVNTKIISASPTQVFTSDILDGY